MIIKDIRQVVEGGYCVGCGACAYASGTQMRLNKYGEYIPDIESIELSHDLSENGIGSVCPSLNPSSSEDEIGTELFSSDANKDEKLGYVINSYAGYVQEGLFRENGTSGGMGTWVPVELMKKGLVDSVIHVGEVIRKSESDPYYEYVISDTIDQVMANSKTRYHVVELSNVLRKLDPNKKYALIGVPCMVKALRRLQIEDSHLVSQIPFSISLVCGHLKSVNWSNSLAWGAGVVPKDAENIQYRTKGEDIPARAYVYRIKDSNGDLIQKDSANVVGGKFNAGSMMLPACEFCDDVVGECADITIGDAWLPRFESDSRGTNLIITRNSIVDGLMSYSRKNNSINVVNISCEEAASSQSGGFRQRRDGLSYRLAREIKLGRSVPSKRVTPGQYEITSKRSKIYDGRTSITMKSRELFIDALRANDYSIFTTGLGAEVARLRRLEILESFWKLLYNKLNRKIRSLFKK